MSEQDKFGIWKINYKYPLEGFVYMWNASPMHQPVEYDAIEEQLKTSDFAEALEVIAQIKSQL